MWGKDTRRYFGTFVSVAAILFLTSAAMGQSDVSSFLPHGTCYLWDPQIVWLHVVSDGLITLAYYCIPILLIYFTRKGLNLPFNRIFWMFGTFILACGTTHLLEIWNIWHGDYLLAGVIKAITAAVSVLTAAMLVPLVPRVLSLPDRIHLQQVNQKLEREIAARNALDASLQSPLRRRFLRGFVAAVLVTAVIGFLTSRRAQRAEDQADWVLHSQLVLTTLQSTARDLMDIQAGARDYFLTGYDPFLQPSLAAKSAIRRDLSELRRLTADNPSQQHWLDILEPQIEETARFARVVASTRQQGHSLATIAALEKNRQDVDAARASIQEMINAENVLLGQRTGTARAGRSATRWTTFSGTMLGLITLVLAGFAIDREIGISARTRAEIVNLNASLEERVEQRTAALNAEIKERTAAETRSAQLAAIVESSSDAIFSNSFAGIALSWNSGAEKMFGYSEAEVVGEPLKIIPPERIREVEEMHTEILQGRRSARDGTTRRRKDGTLLDVSLTMSPLRDSSGDIVGASVIARDITERKQAEELRDRLAAIVESSDDAIISKTLQGVVTAWNRGAEKLFGYSAAEAIGMSMHGFFPSSRAGEETEILAGIARGESVQHFDTLRVCKNGPEVAVSVTISPIRDGNGVIVGASNVARNITQQKAAEREIRLLNEELEQRVIERTAQLQVANQELEAFSYSVSHDLRAPLRHIIGFSRILEEEFGSTLKPDALRYLQRIQAGTQKMGLLVDELLNLARVGRHVLNRRAANLNVVVAEVVAILEPELEGRKVTWMFDDLPQIKCDPVLVKQVFQNLLANALKFTRGRNPVIQVGWEQKQGQTVLLVRDNGVGFNMKYADKLFGVFQRLHRADEYEGTGIGLATAQRIIHKHGGRIWAEGEEGKGATFYFTLSAEQPAESKNNAATAGGQS